MRDQAAENFLNRSPPATAALSAPRSAREVTGARGVRSLREVTERRRRTPRGARAQRRNQASDRAPLGESLAGAGAPQVPSKRKRRYLGGAERDRTVPL